jgi:hypothetical protein
MGHENERLYAEVVLLKRAQEVKEQKRRLLIERICWFIAVAILGAWVVDTEYRSARLRTQMNGVRSRANATTSKVGELKNAVEDLRSRINDLDRGPDEGRIIPNLRASTSEVERCMDQLEAALAELVSALYDSPNR